MKKMISLLLSLVLVFTLALPVSATGAGNVSVGAASLSFGLFSGAHTSTDLFADYFKDLMPGDTVTQNIKINSGFGFQEDSLKLYMQAIPHGLSNPAVDGHADSLAIMNKFLDYMTIEVKNLTKGTTVYSGKAWAGSDSIYLGTIRRGGKIELQVTLHVDIGMPNYLTDDDGNVVLDAQGNPYQFTDACGEIDWLFSAEAFDDPDYVNPKTGDYIMGAVALMVLSGAALVTLLVFKRRRR